MQMLPLLCLNGAFQRLSPTETLCVNAGRFQREIVTGDIVVRLSVRRETSESPRETRR